MQACAGAYSGGRSLALDFPLILCFVLNEPGVHSRGYADWPAIPRDALVVTSLTLGLQMLADAEAATMPGWGSELMSSHSHSKVFMSCVISPTLSLVYFKNKYDDGVCVLLKT